MKTLKYAFRKEWYNIILLIIPFIIIPFIWDQLPAQMPTHWNLKGEVDDYSSKSFALFFLPALNMLLYLFLLYLPSIDPKRRIKTNQKAMNAIRFITILLLLAIWGWAILQAQGTSFDLKMVLFLLLNLFFLVVGNYMKTIRPNYFIGVRTPWTLEDPENWKKTHRMASYLWVGGGVVLLILFPFLGNQTYSILFMVVTGILVV